MVMLCLHSSYHMASDSTQKHTSSAWRRYWCLGSWEWLLWPYIWQQDSTLCYTSMRTQSCLSENLCNFITPNMLSHNSSDCNPLNYYVRGAVEWETNKTPCCTKDELKAKIMAEFNNFNQETIRKACRTFQICLEAMVETNGDFFNWI